MKTIKKWRLLTVLFSSSTALALLGSVAGSLAWYAYVTRVGVSYRGTSVASSEQLQIGLVTADDLSEVGLTSETIGGVKYAFAAPGTGISATAISAYLGLHGYATNKLVPITTREYETGGSFNLYESVIAGHNVNTNDAETSKYCNIPFVFRIIRTNAVGGSSYYAKNENIWLTDAIAEASSTNDGEIYKAIRVYVDGANKFILNPSSALTTASSTNVGGVLDLNKDGYYDYDTSTGKELIYGDYTGVPTESSFASDTSLDDVNGTGASDASTFLAKHKSGNTGYEYLHYSGANKGIEPKVAEYETLRSIAPSDDGTGSLSDGTPIATTANNDDALATCTMKVFLEGWDHSVITKAVGYEFNLGLTFQINRVR